MGSVFSPPKPPSPPAIPAAPTTADVDQKALTEDRLRRSRAAGTSGNVISSLANAKTDAETQSRVSKLLG